MIFLYLQLEYSLIQYSWFPYNIRNFFTFKFSTNVLYYQSIIFGVESLKNQSLSILDHISLIYMSTLSEREMRKRIDEEILNATPEFLEKVQKFDQENQLNYSTIYEIYSTILNSEKTVSAKSKSNRK